MKRRKRKPHTWGSIYNLWLHKGHDPGSAADKADLWELRKGIKPTELVAPPLVYSTQSG